MRSRTIFIYRIKGSGRDAGPSNLRNRGEGRSAFPFPPDGRQRDGLFLGRFGEKTEPSPDAERSENPCRIFRPRERAFPRSRPSRAMKDGRQRPAGRPKTAQSGNMRPGPAMARNRLDGRGKSVNRRRHSSLAGGNSGPSGEKPKAAGGPSLS